MLARSFRYFVEGALAVFYGERVLDFMRVNGIALMSVAASMVTVDAVLTGAIPPHPVSSSDPSSNSIVPGASATAQARFSPDVAGEGDSQSGSCQPQAHTFQLTAEGGGVTEAAIKPATSVCERGTLHFEPFGYAG